MDRVSSFSNLLQVFAVTMTPATSGNLRELVIGWVFAPRRTITGMLRAGGTGRYFALPILARLYLNKKSAFRAKAPFSEGFGVYLQFDAQQDTGSYRSHRTDRRQLTDSRNGFARTARAHPRARRTIGDSRGDA